MDKSETAKNDGNSADATTPTDARKVNIADVKRRLEAEKKRLANLRKNRMEAKTSGPPKISKTVAVVKRKMERRSTEAESKKKKTESTSKTATSSSSSGNAPESTSRKKLSRLPIKSPAKTSPVPEQESKLETDNNDEKNKEIGESKKEPITTEKTEKEVKSDSEDDDQIPLATLLLTQKEQKTEAGTVGLPPDTEYSIGYKLEARDSNEDWYPARVVEVDFDSREVLVHFERWSSRYDEWVHMDSPRLRPPGPMSKQSTKGPAPKPKGASPTKTPPVPEEKPVAASKVATSTPTPPSSVPAKSFKVNDQVMASWSDSRKYPARILEVLENDSYNVLFFDGFKKIIKGHRISAGLRPGTQMDAVPPEEAIAPAPVSTPQVEEDIGSKADRRERKRKINVCELFSLKRRLSPPSKPSSPATPTKTPAACPKSTPKPSGTDTPTLAKKSRNKAPRLQSPGQEDLLLIKSLSNTPATDASKAKPKGTPSASSEPRRVKTLLPRSRTDDSGPVTEPPPPHQSYTRSASTHAETTQSQPSGILEGMQVEMEGDNFKCPSESCGKLYRKENLLQMHIKHYHPELKSRLVFVPKVLDLAYARTVGDLPSTAVMARNSSHAPTSSASAASVASHRKSTTAAHASIKKPTRLSEKYESESGFADKSLASNESTHTPAPTPPACSSLKTGQIKTLLPVNRNPDEKPTQSSPPQLSALQQALMSPPRHLAALLNQSTVPDYKPRAAIKPELKPVFHSPTRNAQGGTPRGRCVKDEKSPSKDNKELVNCMCGIPEEDGLMIQCDLCMCWQHGLCNMIETEDQVPDKYVCHICLNPAKERISKKYSHDQDWLKDGTLPRMPIRRNLAKMPHSSTELLLKKTHDVTASIIKLQDVIHSLRVKINIAEKSDHPKLYLWSKKWETDLKPLILDKSEEESKPGDEDTKTGSQDDVDLHPALKLPLSQSELDHLASTVEQDLRSSGVEPNVPVLSEMKAPEPEAPIEPAACRLVLLEHIEALQSQLEDKLAELERRVDCIESKDTEGIVKSDGDHCSRTKETLRMLQRDLSVVTKISNYASSD